MIAGLISHFKVLLTCKQMSNKKKPPKKQEWFGSGDHLHKKVYLALRVASNTSAYKCQDLIDKFKQLCTNSKQQEGNENEENKEIETLVTLADCDEELNGNSTDMEVDDTDNDSKKYKPGLVLAIVEIISCSTWQQAETDEHLSSLEKSINNLFITHDKKEKQTKADKQNNHNINNNNNKTKKNTKETQYYGYKLGEFIELKTPIQYSANTEAKKQQGNTLNFMLIRKILRDHNVQKAKITADKCKRFGTLAVDPLVYQSIKSGTKLYEIRSRKWKLINPSEDVKYYLCICNVRLCV